MSTQVGARAQIHMGSVCGGERQGQEIVDAANTAGTQSATSRNQLTELVGEVIPLCHGSGARSNSKNLSTRFVWIRY